MAEAWGGKAEGGLADLGCGEFDARLFKPVEGLDKGVELGRVGRVAGQGGGRCVEEDAVLGVVDGVEQSAAAEADDGGAGGHGFDRDDAEVFEAGENQSATALEVIAEGLVIDAAEELDE